MSDALICIVNHYSELIGPQTIGTLENKVTDFSSDVLLLMPHASVMPLQRLG